MGLKIELKEIAQALATERDELRLKAHLFTAEAVEEWGVVEKKWDRFQSISAQVAKAGKEGALDIAQATKELGHEIGEAYKRIRRVL